MDFTFNLSHIYMYFDQVKLFNACILHLSKLMLGWICIFHDWKLFNKTSECLMCLIEMNMIMITESVLALQYKFLKNPATQNSQCEE